MKRAVLFTAVIFSILSMHGQDAAPSVSTTKVRKDTRPFSERIYFGGWIGLSFGTVTSIQLDPIVAYKVDQEGKFSVGLGGSYWRYEDTRYTPSYSYTGYGYRTFARYRFIEQLYGHAEFLHMNVENFNPLFDKNQRIWVPHLLLGAGYVQSVGGSGSLFIQVLFEVLQDPNSIYSNQGPIFGAGVGFGF